MRPGVLVARRSGEVGRRVELEVAGSDAAEGEGGFGRREDAGCCVHDAPERLGFRKRNEREIPRRRKTMSVYIVLSLVVWMLGCLEA